MWKIASRRIKSIFCKHQYSHKNVTSREARKDNSVNCFQKFSPSLYGHPHRSYGCDGQKKEQFAQNDKKENPKADKRNILSDFHNFLDALKWSGICALGLFLLQPFSHRKVLFGQEKSENCAFYILSRYTRKEYLHLVNYFTNAYPFLHVLPKVEAAKPKKKDGIYDSEVNGFEFENIEKAHMAVMGSLSNFQGSDCMDKGNYEEAVGHFEEGAQFQNPAAIYNLGVCYEIGLGTDQDFKKAAEMYKKASDLGHPTATYNLGVFYVHGVGDLKADLDKARNLFQIAAGLGQPNARKALDMENSEVINDKIKTDEDILESKTENSTSSNENLVELSCRKPDNLRKFGIFSDSFINILKIGKTEMNSASSDDSGALDLSPDVQVLLH